LYFPEIFVFYRAERMDHHNEPMEKTPLGEEAMSLRQVLDLVQVLKLERDENPGFM
jgi:hypothetical protein